MSVVAELNEFAGKMNANPEHIENEKDRVYQINLDDSGPVQILFKDGKVQVEKGTSYEPDVTLKLSDKNFSKLLKDDLNTTMAFMTGSLKVDGKVGLAIKLQEIVKLYQ